MSGIIIHSNPKNIYVGMIIRHKGERKVVKSFYRDYRNDFIIQFVDLSISKNYEDIDWDGRK
jgi:hypothetical protein